jgi:HEAT repeat protein
VSAAEPRRGWPWWYLAAWIAMVLLALAAVAWWGLPRWAPLEVMRWSPWPDPAIRASAVTHTESVIGVRIAAWGPEATPALLRVLRRGDRRDAEHALALFPKTNDAAALPALEAYALEHEDSRRDCLDAIAEIAEQVHDESAVAWLVRDAPWGEDDANRIQSLWDVFDDLPPAVATLAIEQMRSPSGPSRIRAIYALHGAKGASADRALVAALDAGDPSDRRAAAQVLVHRKEADDGGGLARRLVDDDESVRLAAARALAVRGDPRAIEPLFAFAASTDRNIAGPALSGLMKMTAVLDDDQRKRVAALKAAAPRGW